jgi:hypothetical protein
MLARYGYRGAPSTSVNTTHWAMSAGQPVKANRIFGALPDPSDTTFHTNILMKVPISTKLDRRSRGLLHGWCTVSTRKKSSS